MEKLKFGFAYNTTARLNGLDHLRTLAILLVFCFHYFILSHGEPGWLPDAASFGWTGVDLFFVLSGFLIASQLFSQIKGGATISIQPFFVKRFFRIVPAYLFTLVLYFCFPFFREKEALPPLWKFLSFTQNLGLNLKDYGTFSHAWSLCVEEHFYFVLPLLLLLFQSTKLFRRSYLLIVGLFLFGFFIRSYSYSALYLPTIETEAAGINWYKYLYYPTYNRLDGLLVGVSIAGLYVFRPEVWQRISKYGNYFLLVSLGVLTAAYFLCEEQQSYGASVFGFPLVAVGYGLMVVGAISSGSILDKWQSRLSTYIAGISYAIYLTHKGIIHITRVYFENLEVDENLLLVICMLSSVLVATLLNLSIERPFMKLRDKLLS